MATPLNLLIVEDSEDDTLLVVNGLRRGGYEPNWERVDSAEGLKEALAARTWDLIISDYLMPQFDGFAALDLYRSSGQEAPFLIVSGNIGEDIAVDAMRAGAHDYIMKDNLKRLVPAVDRELRDAGVRLARKAAQDELAAATALLEKVFSITHVMVAYMDRDFRFIRVNPAYAEAAAREPREFQGRGYFDLFPDRRGEDEAVFRGVIETGKPAFSLGLRLPTGDVPGRPRMFVNLSVHPLTRSDGVVDGLILILLDVTRETLLDEHARQAQKMEALGTLAGGIAHDFNNVLAAIIINTELALADGQEPGVTERYLPIVLQAAERGKELVKQVLAFSRKKGRESKPVILAPILREALTFLRASLPSTIEIRDEVVAEDAVTMADPTEIHQILMNLGTNAAHAMRESGGVMTVRLEAVDLGDDAVSRLPGLQPGPYVRIAVEDTGTGIPTDLLPRIFDPFFTTKGPSEGTGMGLAVVHGIVTTCRGSISVTSEVGKGSLFEVYLPRLDRNDIPDETRLEQIPLGRERILVVDDERSQAESLHDMLERLGYDATFETVSPKALERVRSSPEAFDLIVTDQKMPFLAGTKLAQEVMKVRSDMPIVLCTGFYDQLGDETAASLGIDEIVMKPFTVREISSAIRRALDHRAG
jgi:signal transduction histidine kinase